MKLAIVIVSLILSTGMATWIDPVGMQALGKGFIAAEDGLGKIILKKAANQ